MKRHTIVMLIILVASSIFQVVAYVQTRKAIQWYDDRIQELSNEGQDDYLVESE